MNVKDIIKFHRERLGFSMNELAEKVGVSEATISRWESGEIANMRRDRIATLASVLQIAPSAFVGEAHEPIGGKNTILAAHKESPFADITDEEEKELEKYLDWLRHRPEVQKDK